MRSNLDDKLIWVLSVHVWHSEGARSEIYWFVLYRGCVTSTWPKININAQKPPACKISGHFVHWGPFYGTPLSENRDFALPLFNKNVSQNFWLNLKVVCKVSKSHSTMILVQYRKLLVLDLRKILQFLLHHSFQYSQRFYIASKQIRICSRDTEGFVFHDGCVHSFLPDPWSLPSLPLVPGLQSVMHNICNVFSYLANVWVAVVLPCPLLQ